MSYFDQIKSCPPETSLGPHPYRVKAPFRVKIRDKSGSVTTYGYGIGERIEVLEPTIQNLVTPHERLSEIPLVDGRYIIEWPEGINSMTETDWHAISERAEIRNERRRQTQA